MSAYPPFEFKNLPRWTRPQVALQQTLLNYLGDHVTQPEFAEELRALLTRVLGLACSWTSPDVRVVSREEVQKLCAPLGYFAVVGTAPTPQKILVDLDPTLAAWAVERLLGGREAAVPQRLLRPPTDLEMGVLSFVLLQLVQTFSRGLVGGQELALRLERLLGDCATFVETAEGTQNFVGLGLRVQLGDKLGYVRILLPDTLITEHFGSRLAQAANNPLELARMRRCLEALPEQHVEAQVVGARLDLSQDDIANVEPGDIIVLENHQLHLTPHGVTGQVALRLGRGLHGSVTARLFDDLGEARLEVLQIAEQEHLEGADMDEAQTGPQQQTPADNLPETGGLLREVDASVAVELGRIRLNTAQVVRLRAGQVLRLARGANDPVDLVVGGKLFARGELIEVDGELGVRLTQVTGSR